jgi:hypothetical protein
VAVCLRVSCARALPMRLAAGRGNEVLSCLHVEQGGTLEWIHKTAWKGKGDVYHLVFDLSQFIWANVWKPEDKLQVELLLAFIHHVTGAWH